MKMHNPPHPGEFITDIFLEPHGISGRELALKLDVAPSTLSRILKGSSRVTPEMALRFILSNPDVGTIIPGMRKIKHVESNTATSDGQGLSTELVEELRAHRWERQPTSWSQ